MKTTKFTLTVTIEALSLQRISKLVDEMALQIQKKIPPASLSPNDDGNVSWGITSETVEF